MWIVPAPIEGTWQLTLSGDPKRTNELVLRQRFQYAEGLVNINGKTGQVRNAKLEGPQISFTVFEPTNPGPLRYEFSGRVSGDTMEGTVKLPGGEQSWKASRVSSPEKH